MRVQLASELEEVLSYQHSGRDENHPIERRDSLRRIWAQRIAGCQREVEIWQPLLVVRSLVLDPSEDPDSFIDFANLARRQGRFGLARKALNALLDLTDTEDSHLLSLNGMPRAAYAYCKLEWAADQRDEAVAHLQELVAGVRRAIGRSES